MSGGFSKDDLPPLYCDFDESSTRAQSAYLLVIKLDLAFLVAGGAVSSYSSSNRFAQQALYGVGAACMLGGLIVTAILGKNPFEKVWYNGRAAAESVKSLAWKYMLRAAPFEGDAKSGGADTAFIDKLGAILNERRDLALTRSARSRPSQPISARMQALRNATFSERLQTYLIDRVQDQVSWYSTKSRENEALENRWLIAIISVQAAALLGSLVQAAQPQIAFNFATTLAAVATALLAWSQIKRHRELAQSYSVAAHELGLAAALAQHLKTEADLSQFVNDTEAAISREHTMWVARREAR